MEKWRTFEPGVPPLEPGAAGSRASTESKSPAWRIQTMIDSTKAAMNADPSRHLRPLVLGGALLLALALALVPPDPGAHAAAPQAAGEASSAPSAAPAEPGASPDAAAGKDHTDNITIEKGDK